MSKVTDMLTCLLACAAIPGAAAAQAAEDSPIYTNCPYGFAIIFPGKPEARDITYSTGGGTSVPARRYFVEKGANRYTVTVQHSALEY